ncbi:MAG: hypothetical protein GQ574_12740 [Crocinitomix sp.]|nr:hypothetical protein [Crocinitomix sp.]
MLKSIGYIPPKNKAIELFHKDFYSIIRNKFPDTSNIICAFCCTMNDKNGESLGVFFAMPDRFVYVAAVPDKQLMMVEEFLIDRISDFIVLSQKGQIHSIKFKISGENVVAKGYEMKIPNNFIERLKLSGIILFNLGPNLN